LEKRHHILCLLKLQVLASEVTRILEPDEEEENDEEEEAKEAPPNPSPKKLSWRSQSSRDEGLPHREDPSLLTSFNANADAQGACKCATHRN
jgi:hypothetical protein